MSQLIFSDVHLTQQQPVLRKQVLDWILEMIYKHQPAFVLSLGDTFDKVYVDVDLLNAFGQFLDKIYDCPWKPQIHLLVGNHDMVSDSNILSHFSTSAHKGRLFVHSQITRVDLGGNPALFVPYHSDQTVIRRYLETVEDKANTTVYLHASLNGARSNGRRDESNRIVSGVNLSANHFDGFKKAFSGHFHHHVTHGNFTYVGSPQTQTYGDLDQDDRGLVLYDGVSGEWSLLKNPDGLLHVTVLPQQVADGSALESAKGRWVRLVIGETDQIDADEILFMKEALMTVARDVKIEKPEIVYESLPAGPIITENLMELFQERATGFVEALQTKSPEMKSELLAYFSDHILPHISNPQSGSMSVFIGNLESVTIQNFQNVRGRITLRFDRLPTGLLTVVGPNGAGKTALADAVTWGAYGECSKGKKAVDVMNNLMEVNDVCSVEVAFANGVKIERKYTKKVGGKAIPKLNFTTPEKGTYSEGMIVTQEHIIARLGVKYEQFRRTVQITSGDLASMFIPKVDQCCNTLENAMGYDFWDDILKEMDDQKEQLKMRCATDEIEKVKIEERIKATKADIDRLTSAFGECADAERHAVDALQDSESRLVHIDEDLVEAKESQVRAKVESLAQKNLLDGAIENRGVLQRKQASLDSFQKEMNAKQVSLKMLQDQLEERRTKLTEDENDLARIKADIGERQANLEASLKKKDERSHKLSERETSLKKALQTAQIGEEASDQLIIAQMEDLYKRRHVDMSLQQMALEKSVKRLRLLEKTNLAKKERSIIEQSIAETKEALDDHERLQRTSREQLEATRETCRKLEAQFEQNGNGEGGVGSGGELYRNLLDEKLVVTKELSSILKKGREFKESLEDTKLLKTFKKDVYRPLADLTGRLKESKTKTDNVSIDSLDKQREQLERAMETTRDLDEKVASLTSRLQSAKHELDILNRDLSSWTGSLDELATDLDELTIADRDLDSLQSDLETVRTRTKGAMKDVLTDAEWIEYQEALSRRTNRKQGDAHKKLEKLEKQKKRDEDELAKLSTEVAECQVVIKTYSERIPIIEDSIRHGRTKCFEIESLFSQKQEALQRESDQRKESLESVDAELAKINSTIESLSRLCQAAKETVTSAKRQVTKLERAKVDIEKELIGIKSSVDDNKSRVEAYRKEIRQSLELVSTLEAELARLEATINEKRNTETVLQFWREQLADNKTKGSFRRFCLQQDAVRINQLLEKNMSALGDVKLNCRLDENLHLTRKGRGSIDYHLRSQGEKKRTQISLLLAIIAVRSTQAKFRPQFLFLDEVIDSLDADGQHSAVQIFQRFNVVHSNLKMLLITHSERLKDVGNALITVCNGRNGTVYRAKDLEFS